MKQVELIEKRKPREKHFLQEDGTIVAKIYSDDIHYMENGKLEEIDNSLIEDENFFYNNKNSYKVYFGKLKKDKLLKLENNKHYLEFDLKGKKDYNAYKNRKNSKCVKYHDIINNVDIDYEIKSNKVKESIILKDRESITTKFEFDISTNLQLTVNDDGSISSIDNEIEIFKIEAPYMIDANGIISKNVSYNIKKFFNKYILEMLVDNNWLKDARRKYPIIIDPTITNSSSENNVYDTYIYPGDTGIDKNSQDILKAGVERIDGIDTVNRTLLKFDLPEIGTGSQIINAQLILIGYHSNSTNYESNIMEIRKLTAAWDENTANWDNMNNQYDTTRIDGAFSTQRSYVDENGNIFPSYFIADIADLVKDWYKDTPNNGIMVKSSNEVYNADIMPAFYSKNNSFEDFNPKPLLEIVYRNQNGLEAYMRYITQKYHFGNSYVNLYNGNLTYVFEIGQIKNSSIPSKLNLVYNTNDVVLSNSSGFGLGAKLNLYQTIRKRIIDDATYLEYLDEDSTIHFFAQSRKTYDADGNISTLEEPNTYYDEDGLSLTIIENETNYILKNKIGYTYTFNKNNDVGYLTEIKNLKNDVLEVIYNTQNNITSIVNGEKKINILYNNELITVSSENKIYTLNITNNKIRNITSSHGTIFFNYDNNGLVNKIIDIDSKSIEYEYYSQSPFRTKKITEYGTNNGIGKIYQLDYKFSSTTISDEKNKVKTYTFNKFGNVASITILNDKNNLIDSYGKYNYIGTNYQDKNKFNYNKPLLKYVKNYLSNTIFENDELVFTPSTGISLSISSDVSYIGNNSLKISNTVENSYIIKEISIPKGDFYTFSTYIKNENQIKLSLSYTSSTGEEIENVSDIIYPNDSFEREDITIEYPSDSISNLKLKIYCITAGITYVDAIQLENGKVANLFNFLNNSDFSDNLNGWTVSGDSSNYEIVELDEGKKAIKIKMNPSTVTSLDKEFAIPGSAGDKYTISFWYKNQGLHADGVDAGGSIYNNVTVNFNYNDDYGYGIPLSATLEPNNEEWQFFTSEFAANSGYNSINLSFLQIMNANDLYITNICLYKDVTGVEKEYDANGNLFKIKGMSEEVNQMSYDKNNQLTMFQNAMGNVSYYEYDNLETNKMLSGVTELSISKESKYDNSGNKITDKVINKSINSIIETGYYKIRCKGTNEYVKVCNNEIIISENSDEYCKWKIHEVEKYGETYYKFQYPLIDDKFISVETNTADLYSDIEEYTLFSLIKNKNGSYLIKPKNRTSYLMKYNSELFLYQSDTDSPEFEFYIEKCGEDIFVENNYVYNEDNILTSTEESDFSKTQYEIDSTRNLITKIKNAIGNEIEYEYDVENRVKKITTNNRSIILEYNTQKLLSKVVQGNKTYNYGYNEFGKIVSVKLGDDINLVNNIYDSNNGNLIKKTFGNGNKLFISYDKFNRLTSITKDEGSYNFDYDANGNLATISSNDVIKKYIYSVSQMLKEVRYKDFKIKYLYDNAKNVISKQILLNNNIYNNIVIDYNGDNAITNVSFDNCNIKYIYDTLGRVVQKVIDNSYQVDYRYVTNGKRSTNKFSKIKFGEDIFTYKYNKLNQVSHIYINDSIAYRYQYDNFSELIREDDYLRQITTRISYDDSGNIIYKRIYKLNTYELLENNVYKYNNDLWEDQLSSFNEMNITYDDIGNPLTIGNDITLTWKNGNELKSYNNGLFNVSYNYDENGMRYEKIINENKTTYYYEGNNLILEKNGNNVLYYIRDEVDNLIGLKYNNDTYYYIKNLHDDIIGIMNSNHEIIATYRYDVFGNVLSIEDINGNDISSNMSHIANINSFRYRSYYYDNETGFYYLRSRYYNPIWGRFLNADKYINANKDYLGHNLYAYASNDFVNNIDISGQGFLKKLLKKAWNGVSSVLKKIGMKHSGELLEHSTKSDPEDLHFGNDSEVAKKIKEDASYQKVVQDAINSADKDGNVYKQEHISLGSTDLIGAFHNVRVTVTGTVVDDEVDLHVQVYDKYDYELEPESYYREFPSIKWFIFATGNNLAYYSSELDAINFYEIYIDMDYKYCLVK